MRNVTLPCRSEYPDKDNKSKGTVCAGQGAQQMPCWTSEWALQTREEAGKALNQQVSYQKTPHPITSALSPAACQDTKSPLAFCLAIQRNNSALETEGEGERAWQECTLVSLHFIAHSKPHPLQV